MSNVVSFPVILCGLLSACYSDINECASVPCMNGGSCIDGVNEYTCTCVAGFNGIHCEISKCC